MNMETHRRGYSKTHKGNCKGIVRFVENLSDAHWEWDFECMSCGKLLNEEDVEFHPQYLLLSKRKAKA